MTAAAPSPSVYVGDLDPQVSEAMLYEHFKGCGPVISVRVCVDSQTHKSLGYGYVNFQAPEAAEMAIEKLNGSRLSARVIRVCRIQRDPFMRKTGVSNIVVKQLPLQVDLQALRDLFVPYGKIQSMRLATDEEGKGRGYAYVMFEKEDSAVKAVEGTNGTLIEEHPIVVERYRPNHRAEQQMNFRNLYVKNLNTEVTDDSLKGLFTGYGEVTSCKVRLDETGKSMGFGYVAFAQHEAAAKAVDELDAKPSNLAVANEPLCVRRFESKKERLRKKEQAYRERQAQYAKFPNLYVKNLDDTITKEQLKEVFEQFGPTQSVRVMYDKDSKTSKGFGFVSFKEHTSAQKAMAELAGRVGVLSSRPLFVSYAQRRDVRLQQLRDMQKRRMLAPQQMMGNAVVAPMGQYPFPQPAMFPQMPMQQQRQMPAMSGRQVMMNPPMQTMPPNMMMRMPMRPQPKASGPVMPIYPPHPQAMHHVAPQQPPQPQVQQSLASLLANMTAEQQKNVLGERLYPQVHRKLPEQAAKITGMLLEMDNSEILNLLDSPDLLEGKINEARDVLAKHGGLM